MKNNNFFETEYAAYKELKESYSAAKEAGDEKAAEAAREQAKAQRERIEAEGKGRAILFEEYKEARENGNDCIDLSNNIWDSQVEPLINCLREAGADRFTFSSGWSSAVKTAWLFTENGCRLEGITQINGSWDPLEGEYEKVPAYVFSIN